MSKEVVVSNEEKAAKYKAALEIIQSTLFNFAKEEYFIVTLLQQLTFRINETIPTAGLVYNPRNFRFEVWLNPTFFCSFKYEQRAAILHHELLHFIHDHLNRGKFKDNDPKDVRVWNIAGDAAINQYIKNLPEGGVDITTWKLVDGTPYPKKLTMEAYYELIKEQIKEQKEADEKDEREGNGPPKNKDGNPELDENGDEKKGPSNKGNTEQKLGKYVPMDEHNWEQLSEEDKEKMMEEMKKIIQRTMEKTSYGYDKLSKSLQDLLNNIDANGANINYRRILQQAIKKTVAAKERAPTWNRPNKRFGELAKGSTVAQVPSIAFYNDTSGSISVKEQNEYLATMDKFIKAGSKTCSLHLWHTALYHSQKYKGVSSVNSNIFESGGTDINQAIEHINKTRPNLAIILTDGYWEMPRTLPKVETVIIVSEEGGLKHPLSNVRNCKTVLLKAITK